VWGDEPPDRAAGIVQVYVSNLRRALEPLRAARGGRELIVTRRPGYVAEVGQDELDVLAFEAAVGAARQAAAAGGRPPAGGRGRATDRRRSSGTGRRSGSGAARCWPTWPTSGSSPPWRRGSTRTAGAPRRSGWSWTCRSVATARWWASSKTWWPSNRSTSTWP